MYKKEILKIEKLVIKIIKSSKNKKEAIKNIMNIKHNDNYIRKEIADKLCSIYKEHFIKNKNFEKYSNNESTYHKIKKKYN